MIFRRGSARSVERAERFMRGLALVTLFATAIAFIIMVAVASRGGR